MASDKKLKFPAGTEFRFGSLIFVADQAGDLQHVATIVEERAGDEEEEAGGEKTPGDNKAGEEQVPDQQKTSEK